jgi:hypothetical protein
MSGKSDPGGQWRQTSVIIRSDIWLKAAEMGLDISDELNQRLAALVGIEYRQPQLADRPLPDSVVCAADTKVKRDTESRQKLQTPVIHPVINADDPAAATKVRKAKRQLPPEPVQIVPVPAASPQPETDISPIYPVPKVPRQGEAKKGEPKRKGRDEVLKKFVATKITRVDADDAIVSKDDMYEAFTRWCRDHRITAVPERKVFATLLKNKFAISEKNVGGASCWVHVLLG